MNNTRYMPLQSSTVVRNLMVAVAIASALVLTINGLRLAGVLPDLTVLRLLAPLGSGFGVLALTGVLWSVRAGSGRAAAWIAATGLAAVLATSFLVVVEVVTHYVLARVGDAQRAELLAGPVGGFFAVASFFFLAGMLSFGAAMLAGRAAPLLPVSLLAIGALLIGLRVFLPPILAVVGVIVLGIGIALLAVSVARRVEGRESVAP